MNSAEEIHLASNLLPHYFVKFECSTAQPFTIVIQFKSVQSRLFAVYIYRDVMISMTCLCRFSYNVTACVQNIRHQHADMLWVVHATCQWMHRWRVVQCWAKRLTDAVAIYCADLTSGTQKRQLSYEHLCSWTFNFRKVMRQHIWGEVANFIPSFSAVHLRMQEWKNF